MAKSSRPANLPSSSLPPILREMHALRQESVARILLQGVFVGGCTGGVIGVFRWLYDHGCAWLVGLLQHKTLSHEEILLLFAVLLLMALFQGQLVRKVPLISGSGIPQVELSIMGKLPFPWLRIVTCKFIGTLVSLMGGLSVGREGPSIQMGAAVGCGFGSLFRKISGENPGHASRFLVAGSVAGMTAAFGAPCAGMLFAFEEIKTLITIPHLLFTSAAAASAWAVVTLVFGFGLVFPFADIASLSWGQLWIAPILGIMFGLFGAGYNLLLYGTTIFHDRQKVVPPALKPIIPFFISGLLFFFYPQVLAGFGYSMPALGGLTGTHLAITSLAVLLGVKILFSVLSFASGVPGGILMPMLFIGGMAGALAGTTCAELMPSLSGRLPVFLVLGMTSLFAGTVRAPLTGIALVAEMCGCFHCLPEMLLAAECATIVANKTGSRPIYDALKYRTLKSERRARRKN
ncbi:MAG: ClC family H(+)/Cl(-) exchange transporter [Desulfovibrionaceae bacterium]|nr:ClC family H(+)/Cl(-) exchange transporter [Desulfovibrionaceae bacterium]